MRKIESKGLFRYIILVCLAFIGILLFSNNVQAENIFVEDYAKVMSDKNKEYIKNINEEVFKNLEGEPQFAVVTLPNLDDYDSIEDYAAMKFQELGIGQKDLDNGFLFTIAIEDREFRLETGYGVEAVITDSMKDDIVSEDVIDLLRDEKYDEAIYQIAVNVEKIVVDRYSNYSDSVEQMKLLREQEREREQKIMKTFFLIVGIIGLFILIAAFIYYAGERRIRQAIQQYISPRIDTRVMKASSTNKFLNLSYDFAPTIKKGKFVHEVAKEIHKEKDWRTIIKEEALLKEVLAKYLYQGAILAYCFSPQTETKYDDTVYLEDRYLLPWIETYGHALFSNQMIEKNPLYSKKGYEHMAQYIEEVEEAYGKEIAISNKNKKIVKASCENYLKNHSFYFRDKINYQLEIALMMHYILVGKDLATMDLLQEDMLSNRNLEKAYRFAENKRSQIEHGYRRQALADLEDNYLGTYYLNRHIIWSSYSSSYHDSGSSSSGGGGSSFGGGSSGGGGFSGGW